MEHSPGGTLRACGRIASLGIRREDMIQATRSLKQQSLVRNHEEVGEAKGGES